MSNYEDIFKGGDLRSIGQSNEVAQDVNNQDDFDSLFKGLFHSDRRVVMRVADAIEKITLSKPEFLKKYKEAILALCYEAKHIELKWHLALLVSRLPLTNKERGSVWQLLTAWATNSKESRIVRVNSLQGLYNILQSHKEFEKDFDQTISEISKEQIPSINARIRKIKNG